MDHPLVYIPLPVSLLTRLFSQSARSSCCVPPFIKQNKKILKRVKRDANIITQSKFEFYLLSFTDGRSTDVQRHRDGILSRQRGLRLTKPSQEVQEIQRALAVALGYDEDLSEPETSEDENDALYVIFFNSET